jgi:hypothetical protein
MSFSELLETLWRERGKEIQLGLPCSIEKYDPLLKRADVKPFLQTIVEGRPRSYPVISDIPVIGIPPIEPNYSKGDLVWVGFSTFDISDALRNVSAPESERLFGMENACVLGKITGTIPGLPGAEIKTDGLKIFIGNPVFNLGQLIKSLTGIIKSLGTVGSAAAQSVDPATIAAIEAWEGTFDQLIADSDPTL